MAAALLLSTVLPGAKSPISHYNSSHKRANSLQPTHNSRSGSTSIRIRALQETKEEEAAAAATDSSSADDITQKYGLEFGLWKIFNSSNGEGKEKSKTDQAKELLAKYGGAYLATSITLSLFSFTLCYLLINAGVDVQSLLNKVGIVTDEAGGKVGTFALAYAAHKAASPIRFPPTVALTPIVAGWIGKKTPKASDQ